jgi:hypothetical protein
VFGWINVFATQRRQLLEEGALFIVKIVGRFDDKPYQQIAASPPLQMGHALASEPYDSAGGCSWVDRNEFVTVECFNRDLSTEGGLSERDSEFINEVIVSA